MRTIWALCALLLALVGWGATDRNAVDRGALRGAVSQDLVRLAELGNLRGAQGSPIPAAMPVMVAQEGGPTWITDEAEAAIDDDPVFVRGEPHLLRIEVIEHERTYGIRGQLWRQGWSLRAPEPLWVTPAPWLVLWSALAGAAWAAWRRSRGGALAVSGLVAQLLALVLPWPAGYPRPSLTRAWTEGPLGAGMVDLARMLPDASVAVGAGVVTLCAVLMLFDHRRSTERGGGIVLSGMLGMFGLLAWLEAAMRAGLGPWLGQAAGVLALVGVAGLWAWAWARRPAPVAQVEEA